MVVISKLGNALGALRVYNKQRHKENASLRKKTKALVDDFRIT